MCRDFFLSEYWNDVDMDLQSVAKLMMISSPVYRNRKNFLGTREEVNLLTFRQWPRVCVRGGIILIDRVRRLPVV